MILIMTSGNDYDNEQSQWWCHWWMTEILARMVSFYSHWYSPWCQLTFLQESGLCSCLMSTLLQVLGFTMGSRMFSLFIFPRSSTLFMLTSLMFLSNILVKSSSFWSCSADAKVRSWWTLRMIIQLKEYFNFQEMKYYFPGATDSYVLAYFSVPFIVALFCFPGSEVSVVACTFEGPVSIKPWEKSRYK